MEAHRNALRLERAFAQAAVGAISGAVGTYAATRPDFEPRSSRIGLDARAGLDAGRRRAIATPSCLQAIALAGAGLERLATEIRHLQRTEVLEVVEPFRAGAQKGSSAMPTSATRSRPSGSPAWRGCCAVTHAAVENVALWHERDISHSGAERVILPDSTILLDYLQHRAIRVVRGLVVDAGRMLGNVDLTLRRTVRQRVLLALVAAGLSRDEAYRDRAGARAARVGRGDAAARAARGATGARRRPRRGVRSRGHYQRYAAEIVGRLDVIPPA